MATALGNSEVAESALTPWWRRRDPYVLVPLVFAHAAVSGIAFWLASRNIRMGFIDPEHFLVGLILGQCLLLGIWAALGCLPLLVRWSLVALALLLGVASIAVSLMAISFRRNSSEDYWPVLGILVIGMMLVTLFAALLVPLRDLLSWRLDFDPARHPPIASRRGQVGFMSIAAFSVAVAAPLTFMRLFGELRTNQGDRELMLPFLVVPMFMVASGCPPAYWLLRWRSILFAAFIGAGWSTLVASAHALLTLAMSDLSFFRSWGSNCGFHAGVTACTMLTILALRLCGLQLFALRHVRS
jgi:hypothetical protein